MGRFFDKKFEKKAIDFKRPLIHKQVRPKNVVKLEEDKTAFQNLKVVPIEEFKTPLAINSGDKVIIDFGNHFTGYLHFSLNHFESHIADAPVRLDFRFAEYPSEILLDPKDYHGLLGSGWLQNDMKTIVFTPYTGSLERRYSFRYLLIERSDSSPFSVGITDMYLDSVSAVDLDALERFDIPDKKLERIYDIAVNTLKECEQDVFEDGPKRDRRLWTGDLHLQALTDNVTFKNRDLLRRCLYLFAAYRYDNDYVVSCLFPDCETHFDDPTWHLIDYSMFYTSTICDYVCEFNDIEVGNDLYELAKTQLTNLKAEFDEENGIFHYEPFVDWCEGLDKSICTVATYVYCLRKLEKLSKCLGKDCAWIPNEIERVKACLMRYYSEADGLFKTKAGQLSWHSQIWVVLSGILDNEQNIRLLDTMEKANLKFTVHSPYMMHFYIEAIYSTGQKDKAMDEIKKYWGALDDLGYDCFPEIYNPNDNFESHNGAYEINSACHAWSCTPAYWIYRYYND